MFYYRKIDQILGHNDFFNQDIRPFFLVSNIHVLTEITGSGFIWSRKYRSGNSTNICTAIQLSFFWETCLEIKLKFMKTFSPHFFLSEN